MPFRFLIPEAIILALGCCIDAFAASFAYGNGQIRIPFLSNQIISFICSGVLGVSLLLGALVRHFLPPGVTAAVCFAVLLILGIVKLLDGVTKSMIRRHYAKNQENLSRELKFSLFHFNIILKMYADPEAADMDENRIISPTEAALLALSLSLDGLAIGFGAALGNVNIPMVFLASLVTNMAAIALGCRVGRRVANSTPVNLSWLSGLILIALAFTKLL